MQCLGEELKTLRYYSTAKVPAFTFSWPTGLLPTGLPCLKDLGVAVWKAEVLKTTRHAYIPHHPSPIPIFLPHPQLTRRADNNILSTQTRLELKLEEICLEPWCKVEVGQMGTLANQRHKSQAVSREGQCLTVWIRQATSGRERRENRWVSTWRLSGPQVTELESQLGLRGNAPMVWQMPFSSKLIQMAFWFLQPNNPQTIKEGQRKNTE